MNGRTDNKDIDLHTGWIALTPGSPAQSFFSFTFNTTLNYLFVNQQKDGLQRPSAVSAGQISISRDMHKDSIESKLVQN